MRIEEKQLEKISMTFGEIKKALIKADMKDEARQIAIVVLRNIFSKQQDVYNHSDKRDSIVNNCHKTKDKMKFCKVITANLDYIEAFATLLSAIGFAPKLICEHLNISNCVEEEQNEQDN